MTRLLAPEARVAVRPTSRPTFSIVIPAYQAAAFIGDAVGSALAQTLAPVDVIVCNDGSTDDLAGALAPYRGAITLIDKENGGEASAKNAGVAAARGEYVAILDADDVFLPRRLEALAELATARPDLDLLNTDSFVVVDGTVVRRCYDSSFRFEVDDQRRAILRTNFLPFVAVRRAAYLAVGGFDETLRRVPDWDCWLRMIVGGAQAGLVDEPLAEYRLRATNITADRLRVHLGRLETLERAGARSDLSQEERAVVRAGIRDERREVAILRARAALASGAPDARRRCASVALSWHMGASARLKAAVAAAAPGAARRRLGRHDQELVELAGGIRVRRRSPAPPSDRGSDGE